MAAQQQVQDDEVNLVQIKLYLYCTLYTVCMFCLTDPVTGIICGSTHTCCTGLTSTRMVVRVFTFPWRLVVRRACIDKLTNSVTLTWPRKMWSQCFEQFSTSDKIGLSEHDITSQCHQT